MNEPVFHNFWVTEGFVQIFCIVGLGASKQKTRRLESRLRSHLEDLMWELFRSPVVFDELKRLDIGSILILCS